MSSLYKQFLEHYGSSELFLQLRDLIAGNADTELEVPPRPRLPLAGRDGSEDGLAWFHSTPEQREAAAVQVPVVLNSLEGDRSRLSGPAILWAFPFLQRVMEIQPPLQAIARRLLFEGEDALSIKLALLIFGALQSPAGEDELDAAMVMGRHDEFAWYAARYLYQKLANPEAQLWELAMANQGWGRIMTLKVLLLLYEQSPVPLPICRWLWRQGYQNEVAVGYTAVDILIRGRAKEILLAAKLDDATFSGFETVLEAAKEQVDWERWPDSKAIFYHFRRHQGLRTSA